MKKQTLIIIIIAAAAAYVLYRRGVFSSAPATVGGTTDPDPSPVGGYGTDKNDTDSITDALSLSATDRRRVKDMAAHISSCVNTTSGGLEPLQHPRQSRRQRRDIRAADSDRGALAGLRSTHRK